MVTLENAKNYLRVDADEDNDLIQSFIDTAYQLSFDVARFDNDELDDSPLIDTAIYYAIGYLYEHRESADHNALTLTLRSLLFPLRKGGF